MVILSNLKNGQLKDKFPAKFAGTTNPWVTRKPDNPLKGIRNPIPRKPDNPLKGIWNRVPNLIQSQWTRGLTAPT